MAIRTRPVASGIAVGLNKGYKVTPRPYNTKTYVKSENSKKRREFMNEVIREVCGFAPYEKHIMELLKVGSAATAKRALKFAKKRLGTHKRGKAKRDEMIRVLENQRKAQAKLKQ